MKTETIYAETLCRQELLDKSYDRTYLVFAWRLEKMAPTSRYSYRGHNDSRFHLGQMMS